MLDGQGQLSGTANRCACSLLVAPSPQGPATTWHLSVSRPHTLTPVTIELHRNQDRWGEVILSNKGPLLTWFYVYTSYEDAQ